MRLYEFSDRTRRILRLRRAIDSAARQPIHSVQKIGNRDRDGNPSVKTRCRIRLVRGAFAVPRLHWNPFYGVSFDPSVPVNLTNYVPKDETENLVGSRCANSVAHTWNVCALPWAPTPSSHPTDLLRKPVHRGEKRAASARHRVLY